MICRSDALISCFYAVAFGSILLTFLYDYNFGAPFRLGWYATRFLFLTMVDFAVQCVYMLLGMIRFSTNRKCRDRSRLARFHDFLYGVIAFPLAWVVVLSFWLLYFLNPDLVISEEAKPYLSIQWYNHMLHTAPGIFIVVDSLLVCHRRPSRTKAVPSIALFSVAYISMVIFVHYLSGFWAYPILAVLGPLYRALFIFAVFSLIVSLYFLGNLMNSCIWGHHHHIGLVTTDAKME